MLSLVKKTINNWQSFVSLCDLNIPLEVIGVPIVRDADGLALSSRNGYLSAEQRQIAPYLLKFKGCCTSITASETLSQVLANIKATLTAAGFVVDYVEARTTELQKIEAFSEDLVLFVAAKLGNTRLIDNLQVKHSA